MNTIKTKAGIIKKIKEGGVDISKITRLLSKKNEPGRTLPLEEEQDSRISRLEELLNQKGKEVTESNKRLNAYIEDVKNKMTGNFRVVQEKKDVLENEVGILKSEVGSKSERIVKSEALHKELDGVVKDLMLKLRDSGGIKKELEEKISHLSAELEAKNEKLSQIDSVYSKEKELVEARLLRLGLEVQLKTEKLDSAEKLRIKLESEVKNRENEKILDEERLCGLKAELDIAEGLISSLRLEIETRDRKIEADIGYCERILKELGGLRRK